MDDIEKTGAAFVVRLTIAFIIVLCLILLTCCCAAKVAESPAAAQTSEDPATSETDAIASAAPSTPPYDTQNTSEDVPKDAKQEIHLADMYIRDYFDMTSDEIVKVLGQDYEVVPAGPEGTLDGYSIAGLGMTFVYDYGKHEDLICIDCQTNCDILGASPGMNFVQIQEKLGPAETEEGFMELPEYKIYIISYNINECNYEFWSYSESGSDSYLMISKIREFTTFDARAAGISIDMELTEVEEILGPPIKQDHHYEGAFVDDVNNYYYDFGDIRFEPYDVGKYTVSRITVSKPGFLGPRDTQVGDDYREVITKFPLDNNVDYTQPGDYRLYSSDDGENYGQLSIDKDGTVNKIIYTIGAGGFGSYGLHFEIKNDTVKSIKLYVMNV